MEKILFRQHRSNVGCSYYMINVHTFIFISRGAEGPGREILQRPPSVRLSVCLSVTFSFRTVTQKRIDVFSRNFAGTLKKYIEKCPFTYWLNGRWFLQIVERDSWHLYPLCPLFPCSDFVSQMWGWFGGGGGVMFFSHFMLFFIFLEKNIWEYKIILSHLMGGGGGFFFRQNNSFWFHFLCYFQH